MLVSGKVKASCFPQREKESYLLVAAAQRGLLLLSPCKELLLRKRRVKHWYI